MDTLKYELEKNGLAVVYTYSLGDTYTFTHYLLFPEVDALMLNKLSPEEIDQYLFAIGMAEALNYWKLTASPTIEVKAGALNADQIAWWHDLLIQGMGEYFFTNKITFTDPDFVIITAANSKIKKTQEPQ
ncbi:hypothetical protein KC686_04130, partial [Candidatus Woesebacteria bacterium]|nr:hypothetical protein [Candidatus Woesebacteria bacterium]